MTRMVLRKVDDFEGALTVDATFRFGWSDERIIVPPEVSGRPLLPIVDQDILNDIWMPRLIHSNLKAIENVYFAKYQTEMAYNPVSKTVGYETTVLMELW